MKRTAKVIRVNGCVDCPCCYNAEPLAQCLYSNKNIESRKSVPRWCKLLHEPILIVIEGDDPVL